MEVLERPRNPTAISKMRTHYCLYVSHLEIIDPQHTPVAHYLCAKLSRPISDTKLRVINLVASFNESDPMIKSLNFVKTEPCSGLVIKSATMSFVGHHSTRASPFEIQSVIKKYLMAKCLVCLQLDPLPFTSSSTELLISAR